MGCSKTNLTHKPSSLGALPVLLQLLGPWPRHHIVAVVAAQHPATVSTGAARSSAPPESASASLDTRDMHWGDAESYCSAPRCPQMAEGDLTRIFQPFHSWCFLKKITEPLPLAVGHSHYLTMYMTQWFKLLSALEILLFSNLINDNTRSAHRGQGN